MLRVSRLAAAVLFVLGLQGAPAAAEAPQEKAGLVFADVTRQSGLLPAVSGIQGHGAGWGDFDGDGWPDLYVATFHTGDSKPGLLFRNQQGKFQHIDSAETTVSARGTGTLFADLDNDGDLDLYLASMPAAKGSKLATRTGHPLAGCVLLRNDGQGRFKNVSAESGACPTAFGGRSVAVLDFDGDGLLDLLVGEDPISGYNGSKTTSSRLFRNRGKLKFEDVSQKVGLPEGLPGLGVAAGDVNNDGWPDFFLASTESNRLFLNDGQGKVRPAPGAKELFHWPEASGDNMVCGVSINDVNNDGLLDIVLGQHFKRPWQKPVRNRLYLNRGVKDGVPQFEDVTEKAGLDPLPMKSPHVEIQDFDNDGQMDIYASMVKFADGEPHPVIFRGVGTRSGIPRFSQTALKANDFPNDSDLAVKGTGKFFDKMITERKVIYTAPGPSADYNRDGKIDLFLANWWVESPSMLLENRTAAGNWIDVVVEGNQGVNRQGIGSRVNIYLPGKLGQDKSRIGSREIAAGFGYASGQEAVAHLGLGKHESCDVEVILPHGAGKLVRKGVKANQRITVTQP